MIDLTPLEVRKKKGDFRRTMRGYEAQAVDDFIDLVADRLEQIVREHMTLKERVATIDQQIADYRERERALTEALVSAQEMREDMRRQMEREVDLKLREVEAEAEAIRSNAEQAMAREEENLMRLRARQSGFVQSYRNFLERELAELAVIAAALDGSNALGEETHAPKRKSKRSQAEETATVSASTTAPPAAVPEPEPEPVAPPPASVAAATAASIAAVAATVAAEPVAEPQAAPEPEAVPEPEVQQPAAISAEPEELAEFPTPFDADFDALLNEVPFAPVEQQPPLPLPPKDQFNLSREPAPPPEAEPELEVIDLIDEVDERENGDNDGWISTLLEGKG